MRNAQAGSLSGGTRHSPPSGTGAPARTPGTATSATTTACGWGAIPSGDGIDLEVDLGIGHGVDYSIAVALVMCMQGVRPGS
jgi:hypothetical protein